MDKLTEIQWPIAIEELAKVLGSSRGRIQNIRKEHEHNFVKGIDFEWASKKGSPRQIVLYKGGAIKIAEKLYTEKAANFLDNEGIKKKQKITPESHYIEIIIEAIGKLTSTIKQYPVDGYRIDLYLPDLKLAIECDERGHKSYNISKHEIRQDYIVQKLKCQFIRFNPHERNFNIGTVINQIFLKIIQDRADVTSM